MPARDLLVAATARVDPQDAPVIPLLVHGATVPDIAEVLAIGEQEVVRRARRIIGRLNTRRREPRPAPHGSDGDLQARPHGGGRTAAQALERAVDESRAG
jgi:hypothetical protein